MHLRGYDSWKDEGYDEGMNFEPCERCGNEIWIDDHWWESTPSGDLCERYLCERCSNAEDGGDDKEAPE